MAKKVKINADACIGCGLCSNTAPTVFAINDEGKSEVVGPVTDDIAIDDIIASCPVGAIEED